MTNSNRWGVTIHDVAREAGVAPSTVSRALAGAPRVSEATRARIEQIASDLGYRPSRSAQSLRSSRTRTLGAMFPSLENPITVQQLTVTVREAYLLGYSVFVTDAQESPEIQAAQIARMVEHRVDGVILGRGLFRVDESLRELLASDIPVEGGPALLGRDGTAADRWDTAFPELIDRESPAVVAAARCLLHNGHRRVAFIGRMDEPTTVGQKRFDAVRGAFREAGQDDSLVTRVGVDEPSSCVAEMQRVLASSDRPSAVVCSSGLLTPHTLQGIASAGMSVPDDVSFVTFGDSAWHQAYVPSLSTVRHDYASSARMGVQRIVARIEGTPLPDATPGSAEFVRRDSIAPAT